MPSNLNPFRRRRTPIYDPPIGPPPTQLYAPPPGPPPQNISLTPRGPLLAMAAMDQPPPQYTDSDRAVDEFGILSDAASDEYKAAEYYCDDGYAIVDGRSVHLPLHPVKQAKILADYPFDWIKQRGAKAWKMAPPEPLDADVLRKFPTIQRHWTDVGSITEGLKISTTGECPSFCLFSNLPLIGGTLPRKGSRGVYYEIYDITMGDDPEYSIAIGTACKPYPSWRFPGWNRLGAGFHLDDYHTFHQDSGGGSSVSEIYGLPAAGVRPKSTDTFGCGIDFQNRSLFFTYNGTKIHAYGGVYPGAIPRDASPGMESMDGRYDVFAAIGVQGNCRLEVNFGAQEFAWHEGNLPEWRVENHISQGQGEPPPYTEL